MFGRHTLLLGLLFGAVAIPILSSSSSDIYGKMSQFWSSSGKAGSAEPGDKTGVRGRGSSASGRLNPDIMGPAGMSADRSPLEGTPVHDLAEVLQFDVTPAWLMSRWPRVSAGLAELDLQGYRVPLVTGTGDDDLAGSLTYYFDKHQRAERIAFHGTTGDPRKLVAFATANYKFVRQTTSDPSLMLYEVKWHGKARSQLQIKPARVVRADVPHSRYEVDLTIKRP